MGEAGGGAFGGVCRPERVGTERRYESVTGIGVYAAYPPDTRVSRTDDTLVYGTYLQ